MASPIESDTVAAAARRFLQSEFLCERGARLAVLADWIAGFSELSEVACSRRAVCAAVWFHDAWCCREVRQGKFSPPLVLVTQPTGEQRERAADLVSEILSEIIDRPTRETAARAIREAGLRNSIMPEAQILDEAVNLDSIGPLWLWGQAARCAVEDRPVAAAVSIWERQAEYRYWGRRIGETLRFARSRELARHRCAAMEETFAALRDQLSGGDRAVAPRESS